MSLGSLRQGAAKVSSNNSSGGKGGKGGFFNKLRIPQLSQELQAMLYAGEQPGDPIMLTKPNELYDDIYDTDQSGAWKGTKTEALHVMTHEVRKFKNGKERFEDFTCTAGSNPHAPQPCLGEQEVDRGNKSVGNARQKWAFNVKHLVPYHEVPLMDRNTNQIVMKKDKPGEPVMVLEQCEAGTPSKRLWNFDKQTRQVKPCQYCERRIPAILGAPKVLVLGKKHLMELLRVNDQLEMTCAGCYTRLVKLEYICGKCNNPILTLAGAKMTNEQVAEFAKTQCQCQACGFVGLPVPVYDDGYDPSGSSKVQQGCPQDKVPAPLSIFDCVVYVYRQGVDTQSELVVSPPTPAQFFKTPVTQQQDLLQWLQMPHLQRTFNLLDMYKGLSTTEQAKIIGIQDPYQPQQQQFQQYPGAPQAPQGGPPPQQYGGYPPQGQPQQPNGYAPPVPQPGYSQPGFPPPQPQPGYQAPQQPPQQWGQPQQQPQGGPGYPPQYPGRPDYK